MCLDVALNAFKMVLLGLAKALESVPVRGGVREVFLHFHLQCSSSCFRWVFSLGPRSQLHVSEQALNLLVQGFRWDDQRVVVCVAKTSPRTVEETLSPGIGHLGLHYACVSPC